MTFRFAISIRTARFAIALAVIVTVAATRRLIVEVRS